MSLMDAYVAGNEGTEDKKTPPIEINTGDAVESLTLQMQKLGDKFGTVTVTNNRQLPQMPIPVATGIIEWWLKEAEGQNGFQTTDLWEASEGFRNNVARALTLLRQIRDGLKGAPQGLKLSASQLEAGYNALSELAILMNTNGVQVSPFIMAYDSVKEAAKEALDRGTDILKWVGIGLGVLFGGWVLVKIVDGKKTETIVVKE